MQKVRLGAAQLNVVVGDLQGNSGRIVDAIKEAEAESCDLVVFPELAVTGYPPEDLLLKSSFIDDNLEALQTIAAATGTCPAFVGFVDRDRASSADAGVDHIYNAVAACVGGRVKAVYRKRRLPNYSVFDEQRYFTQGTEAMLLFGVAGVRVGVSICEDAWWPEGPMQEQSDGGAELIVNLNASPFHKGKVAERELMLRDRAVETGCAIAYVNLVGGQDELVFDGGSLVVDPQGLVLTRGPQFEEAFIVAEFEVAVREAVGVALPVVELRAGTGTRAGAGEGAADAAAPAVASSPGEVTPSSRRLDPVREVYEALVLGTRDYVRKNGFADVVIGLSGGIDSSLVAVIAADALGPEHVHGVLMPSRYSSDHSITDARSLATNLGIDHRTIPIEAAHQAFLDLLAPSFDDRPADLTEQNIQSRSRGVLLMALSNNFGWLVLTTSNKSESAVGYSTLYGDSAGGFAVIKDVPKLEVYELCRQRNGRAPGELIPENILIKPPSAELRPGQRDDQSLPAYEVLDPLIEAYVDNDKTVADLIEAGFDPDQVRRICRLIDLAEYKRRQFPPGPRVSTKAFGKDRRLPITNRYRG